MRENRSVDHLVRRASRTTVRVQIREIFSDGGGEDLRIVLTPRGGPRPRLTRPLRVTDSGSFPLRLTAAGRQYLRRHRAVSIRSDTADPNNAPVGR